MTAGWVGGWFSLRLKISRADQYSNSRQIALEDSYLHVNEIKRLSLIQRSVCSLRESQDMAFQKRIKFKLLSIEIIFMDPLWIAISQLSLGLQNGAHLYGKLFECSCI